MASKQTLRSLALTPVKVLKDRNGAVAAMFAIGLVVFLGFTSLAIDMSYGYVMKNRLQIAASAAALAGVSQLPDEAAAVTEAVAYAEKNMPVSENGTVLAGPEVIVGNWDGPTRIFTPLGNPRNAVKVTTRRDLVNGNPVQTFFASLFGLDLLNVKATAIAEGADSPSPITKFLIDDEMLDTDVLAIEDLAADLGMTTEALLSDGDAPGEDGHWFIDIPSTVPCSTCPGGEKPTILELPTGQVGDEALFELEPEYPFDSPGYPSHADFLNWNEDSNSWRYDLFDKQLLDPLYGVDEVNNADDYWQYVENPYQVHVSPVYKSDTSALNDYDGMPAVNALGWRRGLIAYKILGLCMAPGQPNYDQNYVGEHYSCESQYAPPPPSYLPNMVIEVVDPIYVGGLQNVEPVSAGVRFWLVD